MDQPQHLARMSCEIRRELGGDDQINGSAAGTWDVQQPPRFGSGKNLFFRVIRKRNRDHLREVTARRESRGELADENLGAAVHEWHLRLEDQNAKRLHSGSEPEVDDIAVVDDIVLS